jgi:hypothetical protein
MRIARFLALSLLAAAAHAATPKATEPPRAKAGGVSYAPQRMEVVYDLYRNGLKLAQVTDTFTRSGNRYRLVSETHATGPLKMLWPGTIHLESTGVLSAAGLRPSEFQHARSDAPHKLATARLDWERHSIAFQYMGRSWQVDGLRSGAQDQLSQLYQFMFVASLPADYTVQVVGGRNVNDYHYVRSDGGTMQTPLGALATQRYQRITQKPDDKAITVWVAPAQHNLPVQIRVSEDNVTVEQRLLRASIKG